MTEAAEKINVQSVDALVVDDHEHGGEMLGQLLIEHGCEVRVTRLGLDAIRLIEERRPTVLFLDLGMPEIDGYEVARAVRQRFGNTIRIVAVTGFDTYEARELARWAGFDAFISKPYTAHHVRVALRPR
jgi:CheY-like chemotaxis protein